MHIYSRTLRVRSFQTRCKDFAHTYVCDVRTNICTISEIMREHVRQNRSAFVKNLSYSRQRPAGPSFLSSADVCVCCCRCREKSARMDDARCILFPDKWMCSVGWRNPNQRNFAYAQHTHGWLDNIVHLLILPQNELGHTQHTQHCMRAHKLQKPRSAYGRVFCAVIGSLKRARLSQITHAMYMYVYSYTTSIQSTKLQYMHINILIDSTACSDVAYWVGSNLDIWSTVSTTKICQPLIFNNQSIWKRQLPCASHKYLKIVHNSWSIIADLENQMLRERENFSPL